MKAITGVSDISMGMTHTAVMMKPGQIYTFGRNVEGQLGAGNVKQINGHVTVKTMVDKTVNVSSKRGRPRVKDITLDISDMFVSYSISPNLSSFHLKQNEVNPCYFDAYMRLTSDAEYKCSNDLKELWPLP